MSLMSILKSSDPKCKEVKEIIKSVAPQRKDFKTYSGIPPFTNYGYTDLMVDGAPSPHQSDTTLRWLIDRLRS